MGDESSSTQHRDYYLHGCPSGYVCDLVRACRYAALAIARDQHRLSGPLLDRIDIHLEVPRVDYEKLAEKRGGEPSAAVRGRVEAARPAGGNPHRLGVWVFGFFGSGKSHFANLVGSLHLLTMSGTSGR